MPTYEFQRHALVRYQRERAAFEDKQAIGEAYEKEMSQKPKTRPI
jgi:hypothetical protein